jgi:AraC-like DNA-binding protein
MARERNLALGVPRLTELACVSPAHLSRTFRAYFGTTPTEWVNARRLERAADLLRTTQDPIAAIALRCGFENLPYFYRRFTAHYKTTPLAHRQEAPQRVLRSTGNPPKGNGAPWSEAEGGTEGEGVAANGGKRPSPEESIKRSPENHSR